MIKLGEISINDKTSLVEARNKIRILAEELKFGSITATRMATTSSEISRQMMNTGQASSIKLALDKRGGRYGLVLQFITQGRPSSAVSIALLQTVFDYFEVSQIAEGSESIKNFKFLHDPEFKPTAEFIDRAMAIIQHLTLEELVKVVKRRTTELEAKTVELEQTNIRLQEASSHKSQFLASMSHELRTPLNSIIGYTKLMLDGLEGALNEEQRKDLQTVYTNSKHLLNIINDLLDLAKIEAGKMVVCHQTFTVSELLAEVIPTIQQLAEQKGLHFAHFVPPNIDNLYADKVKVKQVLINILANAVKFTNEGSVTLNVADDDSDFTFSVTDTGIGIRKGNLEMIFDSFKQVGPANIAGYEGTGLGLTISQQFIEMQGDRIWAESELGKGSTFTFTLPKQKAAAS